MEKSKILIKIALDLLYIGIILIVYFANIFTYMYNFQIGITHLTVNIESDWFTMHKKEPFAYYKDSLCDVSYNSNKDICDGLMA